MAQDSFNPLLLLTPFYPQSIRLAPIFAAMLILKGVLQWEV